MLYLLYLENVHQLHLCERQNDFVSNVQLTTGLGNKSSEANTMIDIPKIDEMLAWYHDPKFFTSLDLRSGYYHIKFSPEMRHKSAFTTIIGKSVFLRMPFGFAQGAAYFTILM